MAVKWICGSVAILILLAPTGRDPSLALPRRQNSFVACRYPKNRSCHPDASSTVRHPSERKARRRLAQAGTHRLKSPDEPHRLGRRTGQVKHPRRAVLARQATRHCTGRSRVPLGDQRRVDRRTRPGTRPPTNHYPHVDSASVPNPDRSWPARPERSVNALPAPHLKRTTTLRTRASAAPDSR